MSTDIVKASEAIEAALKECAITEIAKLSDMQQTIRLANGMKALREALSDDVMNEMIMPLQGNRLGFRTDKDGKGGYALGVVRDCLVEAMIRGARPIGNEFNIIAGNAYMTKEYFERMVRDFPGLTDLDLEIGVPAVSEKNPKSAVISIFATWKLNGHPFSMTCDRVETKDPETGEVKLKDTRIPIRVNEGQGPDAIIGKGRRKFFARLFERLSGLSVPDGDVDAIDTVGEAVAEDKQRQGVRRAVNDLVDKHKKNAKGAPSDTLDPSDPKAGDTAGAAK
jgi:hypothetical protein